jgi:hypothetical protein
MPGMTDTVGPLGDDGGVQYAVTCHACGTSWQSTSVTGSTRCGSCHTPVYVPLAVRQAAAGRPLSERQLSGRTPVSARRDPPPPPTTRPVHNEPQRSMRKATQTRPAPVGTSWLDVVGPYVGRLVGALIRQSTEQRARAAAGTPSSRASPPPQAIASRPEKRTVGRATEGCPLNCGLAPPCGLDVCRLTA